MREGFESIREELRGVTEQFRLLSLYQRFEHIVILLLTALIVVIVIAAVWSLSLKILFGLVLSGSLDPFDYSAFQAVFGMIFTVIIALEFKKSLLVAAERRETFVPDPFGRFDRSLPSAARSSFLISRKPTRCISWHWPRRSSHWALSTG